METLLTVIETVSLDTVAGKATTDCFTDTARYSQDGNGYTHDLPVFQPATGACAISTYVFRAKMTSKRLASVVLGVPLETPVAELSRLLKERGHLVTLPQLEQLVQAVKIDLRVNRLGTFFFVENVQGDVSIGDMYGDCHDRRWRIRIDDLDDDFGWGIGNHLLVRGLDATRLPVPESGHEQDPFHAVRMARVLF